MLSLSVMALSLMLPGMGLLGKSTGILSTPAAQFYSPELDGYGASHSLPKFRLARWFKGEFQQEFENWFSSSFSGRNLLVRTNNQILYSLFRRSYMFQNRIIVGMHDFLYQLDYVRDYFHECNCDDQKHIESLTEALEQLQNELHRQGIAFVYLITPSKAQIQSSQLPLCAARIPSRTRYQALLGALERHHICYVDGHAITASLQSKTTHQTFTRGGAHWTLAAAAFTANALIDQINLQRVANIPTIVSDEISYGPPNDVEADLASLTNLMEPVTNYQVEHGKFKPSALKWKPKGKLVFEGTSFVGQLTYLINQTKLFGQMRHYFYYTDTLYTFPVPRPGGHVDPKQIDWDRDILDADAIVVENNEGLPFDHAEQFVRDALIHAQKRLLVSKPVSKTL